MTLLERLGPIESLALVGMGKNVGKTTALNAIVREAAESGRVLGLTSIGRDGELIDALGSHPKPPIRVEPGTLVATVEQVVREAPEAFELLSSTAVRTPIGPVVIARATRSVQCELSGPSGVVGLSEVKARMREFGAGLVIVDGAFDRRSAAAPRLTESTVLVSGAALDPEIDRVVAQTAHLVEIFNTPRWELPEPAQALLGSGRLGLLRADDQVEALPWRSPLGVESELVARIGPQTRAVLVGTALTPQLLLALEARPCPVVTLDPTHVLVEAAAWQRHRVRGAGLGVAVPIRLPFLVANPFSPYGWRFEAREFLDRLAEAVAPLPVLDLVLGESRCAGEVP